MTDSFRTRLLLWTLAAMVAGCSTAAESEAAPPTGPVVAAEPAAEPTAAADPGPPECVADKDCMRTHCCGAGDGCAPAPKGQTCSDSMCPKSVWGICRCEASRCTGVFWDTSSDKPRPPDFAGW